MAHFIDMGERLAGKKDVLKLITSMDYGYVCNHNI